MALGQIFSMYPICFLMLRYACVRGVEKYKGSRLFAGMIIGVSIGGYRGKESKMKFEKSINLRNRAEKIIPDGAMTASKAPRRFVQGVSPCYIESGKGAEVWDVDGNKYIDTTMGLGAVILGYSDTAVNDAVIRQVEKGPLFTLPGKLEVEVAEELLEYWLLGMDMVRFLKTGSEATSAAVRLARAVTGRDQIATVTPSYHGWHDWFLITQFPALGVPQSHEWFPQTMPVPYGDLSALIDQHEYDAPHADLAAVIMEPVGLEWPSDGYIEGIREFCKENGSLLIFDEILTGIRYNPTAYHHLGVTPDLVTIGKSMGNGYPIAALAGKREYMEHLNQDEVFVSGTYAGELVSLAASKATLEKLRTDNRLGHGFTWYQARWMNMVNEVIGLHPIAGEYMEIKGRGPRFILQFTHQSVADLFQQECMKRGVLFTGGHNISLAHRDPHLLATVAAMYGAAADVVDKAIQEGGPAMCRELLEGEPTRPAFRRQG